MKLRRRLVALLVAAAPALGSAALPPPDATTVIRLAAAEPGARVGFVEERCNELFDEPLVLEGYVTMTDEGTLVRMVERPFAERATIDGDEATLVRGGRERRVDLNRRGRGGLYLRTLYALLRGDADTIERLFELRTSGGADAWQLVMEPRERALRRWLERIVVSGSGDVVQRIRVEGAGGAWQEMRLIRDPT